MLCFYFCSAEGAEIRRLGVVNLTLFQRLLGTAPFAHICARIICASGTREISWRKRFASHFISGDISADRETSDVGEALEKCRGGGDAQQNIFLHFALIRRISISHRDSWKSRLLAPESGGLAFPVDLEVHTRLTIVNLFRAKDRAAGALIFHMQLILWLLGHTHLPNNRIRLFYF